MFTIFFGCHWVLRQVFNWFTNRENVRHVENAGQNSLQPSLVDQSHDTCDTHLDETDGHHHSRLKRKHLPDRYVDDEDEDEYKDGVDNDDIIIPAKSSKLSVAVVKDDTPVFDVTQVHGYDEFHFLSDDDTVDFIKNSHTLFIMRGLPGSGKSTVVKCIQEVYKERAVVCSADSFFTRSDGTYKFIKSKLPEAHQNCQGKAGYHCGKGTRVVVIDNTNIARWEMSHYIKLAQSQHFYHVVIVEPLSPWRHNPVELAQRNSHNVEVDLIEAKLKTLLTNELRPMYYGWFLNRDDSTMLVDKAKKVLQQCMEELSTSDAWLENSGNPYLINEISSNLDEGYTTPLPMIHCTAAYLARRAKDPYHTCENVTEAIGRKFTLHISGFVFSKRAISARVNLRSKDQSMSKGQTNGSMMYRRTPGNRDENNWLLHLFLKEEEEILQEKYRDTYTEDNKSKHVIFQHGTSAHITLCYAKDGQSKHSGEDILNICELEFYGNARSHVTRAGKVSVYGNNMFQVELNSPISVNTLFHAFYSSRG